MHGARVGGEAGELDGRLGRGEIENAIAARDDIEGVRGHGHAERWQAGERPDIGAEGRRALALHRADYGATGRVRGAHELLAHTPRNAHHGDFHQETSTSNEGSAPRYSNTPGEEERLRPQLPAPLHCKAH